jgi:hypothetical protein
MAVTYNYNAGPTYTKIVSRTLSSAAASVTFSNLPQNYTDLVLVFTGAMSAVDYVMVRVGSGSVNTGSNYSGVTLKISNISFVNSASSNDTSVSGPNPLNLNNNNMIFNFSNYSNNTTHKTFLWRQNVPASSAGGDGNLSVTQGLWRSTSPIDTINFFTYSGQTYAAGCTFTLYGIAAALKPKATGGNTVITDGTYWYHTFTSSGVFTPTQGITADYLVVAGGGGAGGPDSFAGYNAGSGGGAGGLSYISDSSLTAQAYTVTVGGGGTRGAMNTNGGVGSNSSLNSVISNGGGGGGRTLGQAGGSAGGGGAGAYAGGTKNQGNTNGATGYGNNGGSSGGQYNSNPGGGGGAGAVGGSGSGNISGNGGAGLNTWSTWATATGTGVSGYYAGGGGGGAVAVEGSTNAGTGGAGGGGGGGYDASGIAGTANTGGGGGGTGDRFDATSGAAGGSGIVIVRYSA